MYYMKIELKHYNSLGRIATAMLVLAAVLGIVAVALIYFDSPVHIVTAALILGSILLFIFSECLRALTRIVLASELIIAEKLKEVD